MGGFRDGAGACHSRRNTGLGVAVLRSVCASGGRARNEGCWAGAGRRNLCVVGRW